MDAIVPFPAWSCNYSMAGTTSGDCSQQPVFTPIPLPPTATPEPTPCPLGGVFVPGCPTP